MAYSRFRRRRTRRSTSRRRRSTRRSYRRRSTRRPARRSRRYEKRKLTSPKKSEPKRKREDSKAIVSKGSGKSVRVKAVKKEEESSWRDWLPSKTVVSTAMLYKYLREYGVRTDGFHRFVIDAMNVLRQVASFAFNSQLDRRTWLDEVIDALHHVFVTHGPGGTQTFLSTLKDVAGVALQHIPILGSFGPAQWLVLLVGVAAGYQLGVPFGDVFKFTTDKLMDLFNAVSSWVMSDMTQIKDAVTTVGGGLKSGFGSVMTTLANTANEAVNLTKHVVSQSFQTQPDIDEYVNPTRYGRDWYGVPVVSQSSNIHDWYHPKDLYPSGGWFDRISQDHWKQRRIERRQGNPQLGEQGHGGFFQPRISPTRQHSIEDHTGSRDRYYNFIKAQHDRLHSWRFGDPTAAFVWQSNGEDVAKVLFPRPDPIQPRRDPDAPVGTQPMQPITPRPPPFSRPVSRPRSIYDYPTDRRAFEMPPPDDDSSDVIYVRVPGVYDPVPDIPDDSAARRWSRNHEEL